MEGKSVTELVNLAQELLDAADQAEAAGTDQAEVQKLRDQARAVLDRINELIGGAPPTTTTTTEPGGA